MRTAPIQSYGAEVFERAPSKLNREDVATKDIVQTEGNEDEINELVKAFNTRDAVAVVN
jgi:hypothetical protein